MPSASAGVRQPARSGVTPSLGEHQPGLAEHPRGRQVAGVAVGLDLDAEPVRARRRGVDVEAPAPRLEPVGRRAEARRRSAERSAPAARSRTAGRARVSARIPSWCRRAPGRAERREAAASAASRRARPPRGSGTAPAGTPRSAADSAAVRWITAGLMNAAGAIGPTTAPPGPRRGGRSIGLRARTAAASRGRRPGRRGLPPRGSGRRPSRPCSGRSRRRSCRRGGAGPGGAVTRPRRRPRRAPRPSARGGLGGEQDREVGRQRLEAADLDDLHPGVGGRGRTPRDLAHERDLAGQVGVVGAAPRRRRRSPAARGWCRGRRG